MIEFQSWRQASPYLKISMGEDAAYFKQAIETGECKAWRLNHGKAYMITREEGAELVVCCLEGSGIHQVAPLIINIAKNAGFKGIRYHSKRAGMGRILQRYGFEEVERVYKVGLKDGRS